MAHVLVIRREVHLAGDMRLEQVNGRDGPAAKAQLTASSSVRWGEIDYLDTNAQAAQRRSRHGFVDEMNAAERGAVQSARTGGRPTRPPSSRLNVVPEVGASLVLR